MGFTHVELMPITEHPFYGSWGYQTTGYFAPTVALRHAAGLHVPRRHAAPARHRRDPRLGAVALSRTTRTGSARFDGTHLYEHADPRQGFHPDWNSCIFNYGRNEVRAFLLSSALFWLDHYHIDGLRVDAVASMLYLDYARKRRRVDSQPARRPREPRARSQFLRAAQRVASTAIIPDVQMIAEESTAWPMVSRPVYVGGLGFGMKWNMGWMHDTLDYLRAGPDPSQATTTTALTFSLWSTRSTRTSCCRCRTTRSCYGKGSLHRQDAGRRLAAVRQPAAAVRLHVGASRARSCCSWAASSASGASGSTRASLDWRRARAPEHARRAALGRAT